MLNYLIVCNWIVRINDNSSDDCSFSTFKVELFLIYLLIYLQAQLSILHTPINARVYKNPKDKPNHQPDFISSHLLIITHLNQMKIHEKLKCLDMNYFHSFVMVEIFHWKWYWISIWWNNKPSMGISIEI